MPLFVWSKSLFGSGIPEIDEQHAQIFTIANEYYDSYKMLRGKDKLEALLADLVQHASEHFQLEESVMEDRNYPEVDEHRKIHSEIYEELQVLHRRVADGCEGVQEQLLGFLEMWLIEHITGPDRDLADFLKKPIRYI